MADRRWRGKRRCRRGCGSACGAGATTAATASASVREPRKSAPAPNLRPRRSYTGAPRWARWRRIRTKSPIAEIRHRRSGVRRAAGGGDAGFDIERVEAAGLLQGLQAAVADPLEKGGIGVDAAGRAGRSARRPATDRATSCRAGFAARGRLGLRQPARLLGGLGRGFRGRRRLGCGFRCLRSGGSLDRAVSLSSRADNWRASSLKALFSTGVRTGDFGSLTGRNGRTFFVGVSTVVSRSVWGEVSLAAERRWFVVARRDRLVGRRLRRGVSPAGSVGVGGWSIPVSGERRTVHAGAARPAASGRRDRDKRRSRDSRRSCARGSKIGRPDSSTGNRPPSSTGQSRMMPLQVSRWRRP